MRKITRLRKAWSRGENVKFYMHKGIYFLARKQVKDMPTPKQLWKRLIKEERLGPDYEPHKKE